MPKYTVGMWMYSNSGGTAIQAKIVNQLRDRDIEAITDLNLGHANAHNGTITCHNVTMEELRSFHTMQVNKHLIKFFFIKY